MALSMKYLDSVIILAISFATATICEVISWVLIYRTPSYKSLRSSIDRASRKLEVMKGASAGLPAVSSTKSSKVKKMDRLENSLKESSRDLSFAKFKSGGVVAIVLVIVFGLLNSLFEDTAEGSLLYRILELLFSMEVNLPRVPYLVLGCCLENDNPEKCFISFLHIGFSGVTIHAYVSVHATQLVENQDDSSCEQ